MWSKNYSLTTELSPEALWELLVDVEGWVRWNDGIESINVNGPVAVGTTFHMTPPGEETITSTIVALQPGRLITDLTETDGLAIRVEHRLDPRPDGGTEISYYVEVTGSVPDDVAQEIGTVVTSDFPDVIANLVGAAKSRASR